MACPERVLPGSRQTFQLPLRSVDPLRAPAGASDLYSRRTSTANRPRAAPLARLPSEVCWLPAVSLPLLMCHLVRPRSLARLPFRVFLPPCVSLPLFMVPLSTPPGYVVWFPTNPAYIISCK